MKVKYFLFILFSFLFLIGASPWEGAAATAPDGELPATGMFVATNSFPVNTVVDITNIETNKSTRVIVAKGLDSPGLLAIVSRDAAELIGMRGGSIGRIRMVQPSDPIAYLRFIEGQATGIPPYDSGNVIKEENYEHSVTSSAVAASSAEEPVITGPSYVLEPEWQNRDENIITLTEEYDSTAAVLAVIPAEEKEEEEEDWLAEPEDPLYLVEDTMEEEPVYIAEETEEEWFKEPEEEPLYIAEEDDEIIEEEPLYIVEDIEEDNWEEYIAEDEIEEEPVYIAEETDEEESLGFVMVPADENPPESIYGIDPNDIIPETAMSAVQSVPVSPSDTASFSVPRVNQLDKGYYYVQLAALDRPELVENTLSSIDKNYNPLVYNDGDPWYRIMLGPMNQGESAAVLARFKSIGYKDAFVRHAR